MRARRGRECPGRPRPPRSTRPPSALCRSRPPACSRSAPAQPLWCRARTNREPAMLSAELRVALASQRRQDGLLGALRFLARQRAVRAEREAERPALATGCDPVAAILVVQLDRFEQPAPGVA